MKISVLTPTYNDASSIGETLKSLLSQTHTDWEWIVINDGSTDDTEEVIQDLIQERNLEDKCVYLAQENGDQLNALLNGCEHISGDYVFLLHSDDLLPSETFFEQCIEEMQKDNQVDGLLGDLLIINEQSKVTGKQNVREYLKEHSTPALMLLWLGRNIFADFAFHKTNIFKTYIKENYLTWNMPFWLYYESVPRMVNYRKVDFPILKYRVHGANYINNEIGKHNVLNGELRTAIKLMHYYEIPQFKTQYILFRLTNKLGIANKFRTKYKKHETKNKADMIDFIIRKRFTTYQNQPYFYAIQQYYCNKHERALDMSFFCSELNVYCGKDVRAFNCALLANTLNECYWRFMKEMARGFDRVVNYSHLGDEKIKNLLKFFCIDDEVVLG